MSPPSLTWDGVLAWRLRRQFLGGERAGAADAVAHRVVGVQAQIPSAAVTAVAVRGAPADDVDRALTDGRMVRTWAMRGTLHLLAVADAPAVLALVASSRTWEKGTWQREFATSAEIAALTEEAGRVLDGAVLTRDELGAALGHLVDPARLSSGWGTLLKPLAWQGVLVNGPVRDGRPTFTSPLGRPGWTPPPPVDEAARHVLAAWFGGHGPASAATFDAWLLRGATPRARLRGWFADLVDAGTMTVVEVEGEPLYARTIDVDELAAARPVRDVRLLPGFDPWVLGAGTTDARIVPPRHRREVSRPGGWIAPVVVAGGRVVGTWDEGPGHPEVTLFPDVEPPDPVGLAAEVDRWAARDRGGSVGPPV